MRAKSEESPERRREVCPRLHDITRGRACPRDVAGGRRRPHVGQSQVERKLGLRLAAASPQTRAPRRRAPGPAGLRARLRVRGSSYLSVLRGSMPRRRAGRGEVRRIRAAGPRRPSRRPRRPSSHRCRYQRVGRRRRRLPRRERRCLGGNWASRWWRAMDVPQDAFVVTQRAPMRVWTFQTRPSTNSRVPSSGSTKTVT